MEYKIGTDARCAVIGYGSWATAIVGLLAANGRRVGWYVRNPEVLESLCSDGRNPRYLNDLEFDRNSIAPSSDLDAVVRDADIVILATPSAYLKDFLAPLTVPLRDKFVVSAIKGIVPGDYQTVVEYIHDHYGLSYRQIGLVTGPSHAEEVSRGKLSYLTVVCADPENARRIGERFAGENIRLSYSVDLYGVEYAAILKNIYALSVGIAVGLGYGDNFLAVLIANAAGEMTRFLEESYPDERNTQVSAYLGDLLVTCYSVYSRNRRLGLLLGCLRLCCRLLRDPGGLRLCRYGRTASCAEGAVFGDLCSAFFTKSHKILPSFRADTRSRHAAAVSLRINFYCFYYNKFDFGCKCLSGNFKKTSAALHTFCLRLRKRVKHTHFSKIKPGF